MIKLLFSSIVRFRPYFKYLLPVKVHFALAIIAGVVYGMASGFGLPYNTLYAWTRKYPPGSITGRSAIKPLVNHRPSLPQPIFAQVDLADAPSSHPSIQQRLGAMP